MVTAQAPSRRISKIYAQNSGAIVARKASPVELAIATAMKEIESTDTVDVTNYMKLRHTLLKELLNTNTAATFMTQSDQRDYLNKYLAGKKVVVTADKMTMIVDQKQECNCPGCQARRNGTSIEDALKEAFEGFQVVVGGPFDDPFGNPFGDGRENGRAFNPSDFFRDMRG